MIPGHRVREFFRHDLWAADLWALPRLTRLKLRALRLVTVVVWEVQKGELSLRATSLVYTTLLSLIPLLAVAFSVLKAFGAHYRLEPLLLETLEPLGPQAGEVARQMVEFVNNLRTGVLGAAGLAVLFFTVISLIGKMEDALNHIWRVRRSRSLARRFSDYLSLVLVGPVLVFAAFALIASAQSHWLVQRVLLVEPLGPILVFVGSRVMPFAFLCAAFTLLYKIIPHTDVRVGAASLGGITAATLWQLASTGFTAFVAASPRYTAIYSGFAILILFLLWLYVIWLVVLVGAQVAYVHQHPSASLAARTAYGHRIRERLALATLGTIARRHLAGRPPALPAELATALNVPRPHVEEVIDQFVQQGILVRTAEPAGVALGRPPEQVPVIEILDALRGLDSRPGDSGADSGDGVAHLLRSRDDAVRRALEGLTLRSLASAEPAPGVPSPPVAHQAPR